MQTGSSETLIGWKSGRTSYVPLCDRMKGAWLWTRFFLFYWRTGKPNDKFILLFFSFFRSDGAGSSKGSTKGKEKEEAPSDSEGGEEGIKAKKTKAGKTKKVKKSVGKKGQKKVSAGGAALGNFIIYLFGICDFLLLYLRNRSFLPSGAWI
jgi:hypothetical protein